MKRSTWTCLVGVSLLTASASRAANIGTAFTYQGFIENPPGTPVNGTCNFRFGLWENSFTPPQVGLLQTVSGVVVDNGYFLTTMDFGPGSIDGTGRWLEIEVQCPPSAGFTMLSPRVPLTPAPHALALPGLYTQENATSPNIIGGFSENNVAPAVVGATIAGGGQAPPWNNRVWGDFGAIGGGRNNTVGSFEATVAGGFGNTAGSRASSVGGGDSNTASGEFAAIGGGVGHTASGDRATVGGGSQNTASGAGSIVGGGTLNTASGQEHSTVGGGQVNMAGGSWSTIGGGQFNTASVDYSTVGGGESNAASGQLSTVGGGRINTASGERSTVGGGEDNIASGLRTAIGGGTSNRASNSYDTVGGGNSNNASGFFSTIGGGNGNVASGSGSTVGGGSNNTASGFNATVSGGQLNVAGGEYSTVSGGLLNVAGGEYSFAAGRRGKVRTPAQVPDTDGDQGTFVWAGSTNLDFFSSGSDQFLIRASGGVGLGTPSATAPRAQLDVVKSGATVAVFDRTTDDGTIVSLRQAGTEEGTISVSGTTVSYNAFTGSHYGWTDETMARGTLVMLTGANRSRHDNPESERIYGIAPTTKANDAKCLGAYLGLLEPSKAAAMENPHQVMAVGNGDMWVVDSGRNIEPGQYLISSETKGHAMLDDAERFAVGYVVARAGEGVDWAAVSEAVDGRKHQRISVFFESFERSSAVAVGKIVEEQQKRIDEVSQRLSEIEASKHMPWSLVTAGIVCFGLGGAAVGGRALRRRGANGGAR